MMKPDLLLARRSLWAQAALLCAFAALLFGCASMGVPAADTFAKKLAAGYETVSTVSDGAVALYEAKKLSKSEAESVLAANRSALATLDGASALASTDLSGAQTRLTATIATLTALQAYLATKQVASKGPAL